MDSRRKRDREELQQSYLEAALRELHGRSQPPDLRHRVMAATAERRRRAVERVRRVRGEPRTPGRLVAAAILLIATGVFGGVLWLQQDDGTAAAHDEPGTLTQPKDIEAFRRMLQDVRGLSVLVQTSALGPRVVGQAAMTDATRVWIHDPKRLARLVRWLARPRQQVLFDQGSWTLAVDLHLTGDRRVSVRAKHGSENAIRIAGLGKWRASAELAGELRALVKDAIARVTASTGGVVGGDQLRAIEQPETVARLACSDLTPGDLPALRRFAGLTELDLSGSRSTLGDADLAVLADLPKLRHLDLGGTRATDRTLVALARVGALESLRLDGASAISGRGFAAFASHRAIRSISMAHAEGVSDRGIDLLGRLPALRALDLSGVRGVTAAGLATLARSGSLEALVLDDCRVDTRPLLRALRENRTLRSLSLAGADLRAGCGALPVEALDLSRCALSPDALAKIARLPKLRTLSLAGCRGVDATGLVALRGALLTDLCLRGLPLDYRAVEAVRTLPLRRLDLGRTGADDTCLAIVVREFPRLVALDLTACDRVSENGLRALRKCTDLRELDLSDCTGFGLTPVEEFELALPKCKVVRPVQLR